MPFPTNTMKENAAVGSVSTATHAALYTTAGGASAGTEVTGGSPAYARKAISWSAGAVDGTTTATVVFDVPAGVTVRGAGLHTAITAGSYVGGGAVTDQAFASQGTYTLTVNSTVA